MSDELAPPPGWRFAAAPGWSLDDPDDILLPDLFQIGHVLLPEFFYLAAGMSGMWPTDEDPYPGPDDFILFLHFHARFGELRLSEVRVAGKDFVSAMDAFRKAVPAKLWRPIAIRQITEYLADFDEEGGAPDGRVVPPLNTDKWVEAIRAHRAKVVAPKAPPKRRNRITPEHLQAVAAEYLAADRLGLPPTKSVAERFNTSHSTAAKWVGTARRKGFLPPVGEMEGVQHLARLKAELAEAKETLAEANTPETREEMRSIVAGVERDIASWEGSVSEG